MLAQHTDSQHCPCHVLRLCFDVRLSQPCARSTAFWVSPAARKFWQEQVGTFIGFSISAVVVAILGPLVDQHLLSEGSEHRKTSHFGLLDCRSSHPLRAGIDRPLSDKHVRLARLLRSSPVPPSAAARSLWLSPRSLRRRRRFAARIPIAADLRSGKRRRNGLFGCFLRAAVFSVGCFFKGWDPCRAKMPAGPVLPDCPLDSGG
jgi:hypothetical protein